MKAHKINWISWDSHIMVLFSNNVDTAHLKNENKKQKRSILLVSDELHHVISILSYAMNKWMIKFITKFPLWAFSSLQISDTRATSWLVSLQ